MQLFAKTGNQIISANKAIKGSDYQCIECQGIVRKRGGIHRRDHFFHISPTKECQLNQKSLAHIQTQLHIQQLLPPGETVLERRFPSIQRIADVCWEKEKLLFEVQCSSITPKEIAERNRDYSSLGYLVVWILHETRYNKRKASAAEQFLVSSSHYFTNIDQNGQGTIYDQLSTLKGGIRIKRSPIITVNLSKPLNNPQKCSFPVILKNRELWKLHFQEDFLFRFFHEASYFEKNQDLPSITALRHWLISSGKKFLFFYKSLLRFFIEKSCNF